MPRIRTIKPDFFASDDVAELPIRARLTWIGLWTQADDHGRWKDNARLVKAAIWPLDDVSLKDVESDLNTLADCRRIVRYSDSTGRYLAIRAWHVHQAINRPSRAKYPAPPEPVNPVNSGEIGYCQECATGAPQTHITPDSLTTQGGLTEDSHQERKGRDQGKEGKRARGSRLPDGWEPTDAHRGYAAANNLLIEDELARFRDHHLAKGSIMKDWDAAFRLWMRNSVKWAKPTTPEPPKYLPDTEIERPPVVATDEELRAWYAAQRAKKATA